MEIAQCQTYFRKEAEWNESYSSMTRPQTAILEGGEIELDAEISELNIFLFFTARWRQQHVTTNSADSADSFLRGERKTFFQFAYANDWAVETSDLIKLNARSQRPWCVHTTRCRISFLHGRKVNLIKIFSFARLCLLSPQCTQFFGWWWVARICRLLAEPLRARDWRTLTCLQLSGLIEVAGGRFHNIFSSERELFKWLQSCYS